MRQSIEEFASSANLPVRASASAAPTSTVFGITGDRSKMVRYGAALAFIGFSVQIVGTATLGPSVFTIMGFLAIVASIFFFQAAYKLTTPDSATPQLTDASSVDQQRAQRLAAALSTAPGPVAIEEIAQVMRWTPQAVATGLKVLADRGEVVEDLDLETGHWIYVLASRQGVSSTGSVEDISLEERIEQAVRESEALGGQSDEAYVQPEAHYEPTFATTRRA